MSDTLRDDGANAAHEKPFVWHGTWDEFNAEVARRWFGSPAMVHINTDAMPDLLTDRLPVDGERAELATLRALRAAAAHFADIWRDTLPDLPDSYGCQLNCPEANAAADLYRALGDEGTAQAIIASHAHYDEDGDEHYGYQPAAASGTERAGDGSGQ